MLQLEFYGTSAAYPDGRRGYSCIGMRKDGDLTLLDCGDGAVHNLIRFRADLLSIRNIFITHYHSDHISGLVSLIETMGILKRTTELGILGPRGIKKYFDTIQKITHVAEHRKFKITLTELQAHEKLTIDGLNASAFPLQHSIDCFGYRIEAINEKRERIVVSYSGDTEPCSESLKLSKDADFLIHEATFLAKGVAYARLSKHSTALEAAKTAKRANAKRLILTHTSFYNPMEKTLSEAKTAFPNVKIAYDGLVVRCL